MSVARGGASTTSSLHAATYHWSVRNITGSAIDRLSILALRLYHLDEQTARLDATPDLVASVNRKIAVGLAQQKDLSKSLAELLADIYAGRKRHGMYQQMKMYNDPKLNPQIYNAQRRAG